MLPTINHIKRLSEIDEQERKLAIERALTLEKAYNSGSVEQIFKAEQYYTSLTRGKAALAGRSSDNPIKSIVLDPLETATSMGYYHKHGNISYETLRNMAKTPVISSIIRTRVNQFAEFLQPQPDKYSPGFVIARKGVEDEDELSDSDRKLIDSLTEFIMQCGDPATRYKWDKFNAFGRKVITDSLTFDQACLLPGAWVEMANGTAKKIEDIQVNEQVRTHADKIRNVIAVKNRIFDGEFVIVCVGGQKLTMTNTHPILASKKISLVGNTVELSDPEWMAAGDLTENHYVVYPKLNLDNEIIKLPIFNKKPRKYVISGDIDKLVETVGVHKYYVKAVLSGTFVNYKKFDISQDKINEILLTATQLGVVYDYKRRLEPITKIDSDWGYMLGLYLAEGYVSKSNSVTFTFNKKERDRVSFLVSFFEKYGINTLIHEYDNRNGITVHVFSKSIVDFITQYCGVGSCNKFVPDFIYKTNESVVVSLLKGYLGGDGYVRNNQVSYTSTSKNLFYGIRKLLSSQGVYVREVHEKSTRENWNDQFKGNVSGLAYRVLAEKMQFPISDLDGRRSYIDKGSYLFSKISDIEKYFDKQVVYNLEIEEDHSYIANGFINHNCFEIVPYRNLEPYAFCAVDSATFRFADSYDNETNIDQSKKINGEYPSYVQLYMNQIHQEYYPWEICFGIRNPQTNIRSNGYGRCELEDLITTVTAQLNADRYNYGFFRHGSAPKGMLMVKKPGAALNNDRISEFRRNWNAMLAGAENAHKTPILDAEGFEWIDLQKNNRDMEFFKYIEYLVKVSCAVYTISPEEIGFSLEGSGANKLGSDSGEAEKSYSLAKGLKPLLVNFQQWINDYLIGPKTNHKFEFKFVGMQVETPKEEEERLAKAVTLYLTPDEVRKAKGLKPLLNGMGKFPLNPIISQKMMMDSQIQQQGQQFDQEQQGKQEEQDQQDFDNTNPFLKAEKDNPFVNSFNEFVNKEMVAA